MLALRPGIIRRLGLALGLAAFLLATLSFVSLKGFRSMPVLSGSMAPSLPAGSLLLIRPVQARDYRVGDIAVFRVPFHRDVVVAHRITSMEKASDGIWTVATKGDANASGDTWKLSLGNLEGKAWGSIPYVGYALAWTKTSFGFLAFVLASFFLVVLGEMRTLAAFLGRGKPV